MAVPTFLCGFQQTIEKDLHAGLTLAADSEKVDNTFYLL